MLNLQDKNIILASKSPRRQELLKGLDIDFEIRVKEIEEVYPTSLNPYDVPAYLAELKSEAFANELEPQDIVITSDTIVILDGTILEKPLSATHAHEMLSTLAGKTHTVVTAVCISSLKRKRTFTNRTRVTFSNFSSEEIDYYIERYKPFDKAGSYGCQDWLGYIGIERMEGSFYAVMGLPVHQVYHELKEFL